MDGFDRENSGEWSDPGSPILPNGVINGDVTVRSADITWQWTATATHKGRVRGQCSTSWSLHLTIQNGTVKFE